MTGKPVPALWMGMAWAVAAALAAAVLAGSGTDPKSLGAALRLTGRWSFLLFWLAYAAGPMAVLFGGPFDRFARRGRAFGLAFAAAHLVHLGLVVWLYQVSAKPPLSTPLFVFFAIGIFWTYLLAILSFGGLTQALGPRLWRAIRILGMNYILLAFARDFVPPVLRLDHRNVAWLLAYGPFAVLCLAAPVLSLTASVQGRRRRIGPATA